MPTYRVILGSDAIGDLDRLRRYNAVAVLDTIDRHLTVAPMAEGRSRIKRLRGPAPADYRLRVGEYRVFYRVAGSDVHVLRVLHKDQTKRYYEEGAS
jgi:mRNA-degrading endonuclease RelE of RelBE toxin-antitoxin system